MPSFNRTAHQAHGGFGQCRRRLDQRTKPRAPLPLLALTVSSVEEGASTVEGTGHEVTVDLVRDLDAFVAEPAGHLGDRDPLSQRGRCVQVAQRVRDELRRQPGPGGGTLEVLLVGAADDELVLAALEQVTVRGGAVLGNLLVDRLADVLGQRNVAELTLPTELQRSQVRYRASSRRRSSSARLGRQPVPRRTGAGSSRPREPCAGQPGAGRMHAHLRPRRQVRRRLGRRSRQPPAAGRAAFRAGADQGAALPGDGRRHRVDSPRCPGS
jgi:hypothetical protein